MWHVTGLCLGLTSMKLIVHRSTGIILIDRDGGPCAGDELIKNHVIVCSSVSSKFSHLCFIIFLCLPPLNIDNMIIDYEKLAKEHFTGTKIQNFHQACR